jgi:hypothetical protein
MAVLRQAEVSVRFDLKKGMVTVGSDLERKLDGVKIDYVEREGERRISEGVTLTTYATNGRCIPYVVRIEDSRGDALRIEVDALAAAAVEED